MRAFVLILTLLCLGCSVSQNSSPGESTPSSTDRAEPTQAEQIPTPRGRDDVTLAARSSPIVWPEGDSLELSADDSISVSDWIGGVAGTDTSSVTVKGDGTVIFSSTRQGGPGGRDEESFSRITPEMAQDVFQRLKDSKLLDQDESSSGTTGSTLTVELDGRSDRVSVAGRRGEAYSVLGEAQHASEASDSSSTPSP